MGMFRANNGKKKKGIRRLKIVAEKLQKSLSLALSLKYVKGGHFTVIAMENNSKPKRFVVPLSLLNHPAFLMLLELSAEVFGFDHEGALCVPCHWSEMEEILATNDGRRR